MLFLLLLATSALSDFTPMYNTRINGKVCPGNTKFDLGDGYSRINLLLSTMQNVSVDIIQDSKAIKSCPNNSYCMISVETDSSKNVYVMLYRDATQYCTTINDFKVDGITNKDSVMCSVTPELNTELDDQDGKLICVGYVYTYSLPPFEVFKIDAIFDDSVFIEIKQDNTAIYSKIDSVFFDYINNTISTTSNYIVTVIAYSNNTVNVRKIDIVPIYSVEEIQKDNSISIAALVISLCCMILYFVFIVIILCMINKNKYKQNQEPLLN